MIAEGNLAVVHRLHRRDVVLVRGAVLLETVEPGLGRALALEREDRADDRLEVGAGWRVAELALPLRIGEIHDRARQVGRLDVALVVDEHRGAGSEPHPVVVRRPVAQPGTWLSVALVHLGAKPLCESTRLIPGEFSVRNDVGG